MWVEGGDASGQIVTRNVPVLIGGRSEDGKARTLLVGTDGSIEIAAAVAFASPSNATVTSYVSSLIVKPGPGILYGLSGFNSKTSAQFVQIHDFASVPGDSAIPVNIVYVPAMTSFSVDYGDKGRGFELGIVICNSSTGPTKTIGSADCWFDAQFS